MARQLIQLLATSLAFQGVAAASTQTVIAPSEDAIRQNAFHIFNAVHSAMRQWGSSINHNGMSFFLATVPAGQPLYHGTRDSERPQGFEWLAFEAEHASGLPSHGQVAVPDAALAETPMGVVPP